MEETRPNEFFELVQDEKGSHIMSTKDLCLVNHIDKLIDIGIDSFKVEGRTKSLYYVSGAARAYRKLMDGEITPDEAYEELLKIGNRGYTEGFFMENNNFESYSYDISKGLAGADFLGIFLNKKENKKENSYEILFKNKVLLNDTVEIITPNYSTKAKVIKIEHKKQGETAVANTNDESYITFDCVDETWQKEYDKALLRTEGLKK